MVHVLFSTNSIQIRKLQSYLNSKRNDVAVISPAYQWAEGIDEVCVCADFDCSLLSISSLLISGMLPQRWVATTSR